MMLSGSLGIMDHPPLLHSNKPTTPVVALTANAMKGDKQKCISAGCSDYLSKPIDHNKLLGILTKYLSPKITEKPDFHRPKKT